MLFPIITKAMDDLVATLERIKKPASQIDLVVHDVGLLPEELGQGDFDVSVAFSDFKADENAPMGTDGKIVTFGIEIYTRIADASKVPLMNRLLLAAAIIEEAVMRDPFRGKHARNTEITEGSAQDFRPLGFYGVELLVVCNIRHFLGNGFQPPLNENE
jgi:hypothetical protein